MSGKNGEKIENLRYRISSDIETPGRIELQGGMLVWQYHDIVVNGDDYTPQSRPVQGCLEEFIGLADASEASEVLEFVQNRGVLGLNPLVHTRWWDAEKSEWSTDVEPRTAELTMADWIGTRFYYQENVLNYVFLASRFRCTLSLFQSLKEGVPVKESDLLGCAGMLGYDGIPEWLRVSPTNDAHNLRFNIYDHVYREINTLCSAAALRITMTGLSVGGDRLIVGEPPVFELSFGAWADGTSWDYKRARQSRENGMILDGESLYFYETNKLMRDWARPFASYSHEESLRLPQPDNRPSPLLNLLLFQLMKAITLPEGTYFCNHCHKPFTHRPGRGNKPRRGGESGAFCDDTCRQNYKTAYDRERYLYRKKLKKESGQLPPIPQEQAPSDTVQ